MDFFEMNFPMFDSYPVWTKLSMNQLKDVCAMRRQPTATYFGNDRND